MFCNRKPPWTTSRSLGLWLSVRSGTETWGSSDSPARLPTQEQLSHTRETPPSARPGHIKLTLPGVLASENIQGV